jgi:hypothetical protein
MIKKQLMKLKENWLIIVLVLVLFAFFSGSSSVLNNLTRSVGNYAQSEMMYDSVSSSKNMAYYPSTTGDFAPEAEERKIVKTTSMSTEVDRGDFKNSEAKLKNIVISSDSFILSENVNSYGYKRTSYQTGSYQIKVEEGKYDSVIMQLKEIGEIKSFNENAQDVTGSYTNIEINLQVEKERLMRYLDMYAEATEINDKINLNDRIFNQERTIRYLEDSLKNIDKRIEYSTIYLTLTEERSNYANIVVVKFSELIRGLVGSFNNLIQLVFVLIPWAIAVLIIGWIVKLVKRKK